jgi:hypothetical protein
MADRYMRLHEFLVKGFQIWQMHRTVRACGARYLLSNYSLKAFAFVHKWDPTCHPADQDFDESSGASAVWKLLLNFGLLSTGGIQPSGLQLT